LSAVPSVVIIGSVAVGITVRLPRLPVLGETLMGDGFDVGPGGKGANMATAAARLGVSSALVAAVGDDVFGDMAHRALVSEGVDTSGLRRVEGVPTHVGLTYLLPGGLNTIGGYAGASDALTPDDVWAQAGRIREADVVVVEFGAPSDAVAAAIEIAAGSEGFLIVNPAPAREIDPRLLAHVDILTPNETESRLLLGHEPGDAFVSPSMAAQELRALGVGTVIVTLGADGGLVHDSNGVQHVAAFPVPVVDTVGAGDAFTGGLAAAHVRGLRGRKAIDAAMATAALSTRAMGAVTALPSWPEVERLMREHITE